MTTNKDLRRRETDKFGEWVQQAALDDANKRIAELERLLAKAADYLMPQSNFDLIDIMFLLDDIDLTLPPPAAAKEGE